MKWSFGILLFLFSVLSSAQQKDNILNGTWKVVSIMDSTPTTSFSEKQASRLIGKRIVVSGGRITFDREVCHKPVLNSSIEDAFEYFSDGYKMDPVNLGLPSSVTVIHLECENLVQLGDFYMQAKNIMVFYHDGGFFYKAVKEGKSGK